MRLVFTAAKDMRARLQEIEQPIRVAAQAAIVEAGNEVKADGRANIAAAGFGKKWQNALRADVYPKRGASMRAAVHIWHKIPYAGIFEEGGQIPGQPFLWLPLPTAPVSQGRRIPVAKYRDRVGHPLYSIKRPSGPPLLGANVRTTKTRVKALSLAALKRGRNPGGKGEVKLVPLYIGVPLVNVRKRFDIVQIVRRVSANLAELYFKHARARLK